MKTVLENFEPDLPGEQAIPYHTANAIISIAVSLKRIADALCEGTAAVHVTINEMPDQFGITLEKDYTK